MTGLDALAAHLDYATPEHREGCTAKGWEVDYRIHRTVRESSYSGHSCPLDAEDNLCGHGDAYRALTVRIYCPKCGAATKLDAELPATPQVFDTGRLGMGTKPRRCGQVWVYQGPPHRRGIMLDPPGDPRWYLVARRNALRLAPEDIVGAIEPGFGPRGGPGYTVSYGLTELSAPEPGERPTPVFRHHPRADDRFFTTVTAAARWLDEHAATEPAMAGRTV
ncbi:hypothetical protein [Streptomyces griseorubiginosus]|uniref:hypothetical protein n=1 Tax=Streptomyces griseorubiginosus TaxID=67304 RepID=UPI002E8079B1|nr:hypothetical protein [Streptomyces griseorubiginosus]WUB58836.1 hypothetical protein OG942_43470 [Streptomyces griseorubiginosus]